MASQIDCICRNHQILLDVTDRRSQVPLVPPSSTKPYLQLAKGCQVLPVGNTRSSQHANWPVAPVHAPFSPKYLHHRIQYKLVKNFADTKTTF